MFVETLWFLFCTIWHDISKNIADKSYIHTSITRRNCIIRDTLLEASHYFVWLVFTYTYMQWQCTLITSTKHTESASSSSISRHLRQISWTSIISSQIRLHIFYINKLQCITEKSSSKKQNRWHKREFYPFECEQNLSSFHLLFTHFAYTNLVLKYTSIESATAHMPTFIHRKENCIKNKLKDIIFDRPLVAAIIHLKFISNLIFFLFFYSL